ncbi:polyprenyl synthetase family protein [Cohnella sp. JJ-181]|uniref:polyprenyl synthetase family protein n=1 Tax=Cohnella rhizoplanae TaxID=2974897 RepID=UPI0023303D92|nr:polyprenyl synthetase family protein [Cohnella sp. JJ-181]
MIDTDACYGEAEREAARYYALLEAHVRSRAYIPALTEDMKHLKRSLTGRFSWPASRSGGKDASAADRYRYEIRWLRRTGKLADYLNRSVSYIYMRDLGKDLQAPETKAAIQRSVAEVERRLVQSTSSDRDAQPGLLGMAELYRWAQKEGVECAVIWVVGKLRLVADRIPAGMNAEHAQRKLIKIIVGVVMHALDELTPAVGPEERARRLDAAIRLGYAYGLTYPFIDDLLDAQVLDDREKEEYSSLIRSALVTGEVPEKVEWNGANAAFIHFVHQELRDAFAYIKEHQRPETQRLFFEQAYVFFHAQETDRARSISDASITNEALYVPIILKSASSRLIARSVLHAPADEGFEARTFYYGIYNQLADDFADLSDDMADGAVTPYTYYMTHHERRPDLINPFELYWAVIYHLIHHVYDGDAAAREVILKRAINGLRRFRARVGADKYKGMMDLFAAGHPAFNKRVQRMVRQAKDVEFFDKLLRDRMVDKLRSDRRTKAEFRETVRQAREQINDALQIAKPSGIPRQKEALIDAANYSLAGDGKRLRPIMTWVMGVQGYGLQPEAIVPLLRSLEYMHTASLIFDDLPSQDDAALRRGRATLHLVHGSATAELTGLLLIQKAIHDQARLDERFAPGTVLAMMRFFAATAEDLCAGQAMDLDAKDRALTLEQLQAICYYKTGLAFEAALVMPAILAQASEREIAALKKFAYHAGIAFQIKDDLLDEEGDAALIGKPVGQDARNRTSTFVTVLGTEAARKAMWEHYCLAAETLRELPRLPVFLKHMLGYMIHRDR